VFCGFYINQNEMNSQTSIEIRELITVQASGDAACSRTYSFLSSGDPSANFPDPLHIDLNGDAIVTSVHFQGRNAEDRIRLEAGAYQLTVMFFPGSEKLSSGSEAVLTIEYRWPHFLPRGAEPSYRTVLHVRHPFTYVYELKVCCHDVGFLGSPAFKIAPESCRPRPPYVNVSPDKRCHSVRTNSVPSSTTLVVTISGGHGDLQLPVLQHLSEQFKAAQPFADVTVLFVQHLLSDFECTIDAFVRAGLNPENAFIVGIPYSTKENVHTRLEATFGYVAPQFDRYPFDSHLPGILDQVFEHCRTTKQRFLVVEDGGYIARRFREDPSGSKWAGFCMGIVEQTANGIRVTREWETRPQENDNPLNVGVINVADTLLKNRLESPLIGQAVVFNLQRLLSEYEEQNLRDRRALVIGGCGRTGSQIVRELLRQGGRVTVVDARAPGEEFPSEATYRPDTDLLGAIAGHQFVIGCTGNGMGFPERDSRAPFYHEEHFQRLDDRAVLVNASSKLAEFNWDALKNLADYSTKRGFGHERRMGNRIIRVAADGFPINFFNSESVPGSDIQPVLAMLFLGACRLTERPPRLGLNDFAQQDQELIEGIHNRFRERR
jgi:S-adenosylhomocysteine hydrolase